MSRGPIAVLVACLGLALPAGAESLYVIDQLLVGVHDSKERTSAILELLPSGTRLDIVEREGEFVRVKTAAGTTGWVDGKYLAEEKPARSSLSELESRYQEVQQSLEAARKELKASQTKQGKPLDEKAHKELETLRSENSELKETIASAEAQLTELARAQAAREAAAAAAEPPRTDGLSIRQVAFEPVTWGVLGAVLILGLILGSYLMDYRQRRRHGGFRI